MVQKFQENTDISKTKSKRFHTNPNIKIQNGFGIKCRVAILNFIFASAGL